MNKKRFIAVVLAFTGLFLWVGCAGQSVASDDQTTISVGSKKFTEQIILGHMIAEMLEHHTDYNIVRNVDLGATDVLTQAMRDENIHVYVEYTGTALMTVLKADLITDPEEAYQVVKENYEKELGLTWLDHLGFNNTHAMSVREDFAEEHGLVKNSDLSKVANQMTMGSPPEFYEREDGFTGFVNAYGLTFADTRTMDPGLMYTAIREEQVDIINAFSTDGRIIRYGLRVLEDDKQFFPPYYAAPVIRMDLIEEHPDVAEVINRLSGQISEEEMAEMNAKVDMEGMREATVAKIFLQEKGLID